MTVKELIKKLQKAPPGATVLYYDEHRHRRADRVEQGVLTPIGQLQWWVDFHVTDAKLTKRHLDAKQEVALLIR